jgi:RimJ/RimL family protein N-acetyltransferase
MLGVGVVPSRVFAENLASWNVQRKLGFEVVRPGRGFCLARGAEVDDLRTILHRERFVRQPQ